MTRRVTCQTKALVTFVLGGARSGKSAHAEALVQAEPAPWVYVATSQAFDDEMRARIVEHRARRPPGWRTVEAPLDLPAALAEPGPMLVDCLTLWLTNLMLAGREPDWPALLAALDARAAPTVLVSNEVGLGIVPDNALARAFRDVAGRLHQRVAARADRVVFMVAGLPMIVKAAEGPVVAK
jgi:adenosylcobinamide kinase/adenosylcobinamide-phosphate guanylyltransferase